MLTELSRILIALKPLYNIWQDKTNTRLEKVLYNDSPRSVGKPVAAVFLQE